MYARGDGRDNRELFMRLAVVVVWHLASSQPTKLIHHLDFWGTSKAKKKKKSPEEIKGIYSIRKWHVCARGV